LVLLLLLLLLVLVVGAIEAGMGTHNP
jgi:hypothetical protein